MYTRGIKLGRVYCPAGWRIAASLDNVDCFPFSIIVCVLLCRNDLIHLRTCPWKPKAFSRRATRMLWSTVLKAVDKNSRRQRNVTSPQSAALSMSDTILSTAVSVELWHQYADAFLEAACCPSERRWFDGDEFLQDLRHKCQVWDRTKVFHIVRVHCCFP